MSTSAAAGATPLFDFLATLNTLISAALPATSTPPAEANEGAEPETPAEESPLGEGVFAVPGVPTLLMAESPRAPSNSARGFDNVTFDARSLQTRTLSLGSIAGGSGGGDSSQAAFVVSDAGGQSHLVAAASGAPGVPAASTPQGTGVPKADAAASLVHLTSTNAGESARSDPAAPVLARDEAGVPRLSQTPARRTEEVLLPATPPVDAAAVVDVHQTSQARDASPQVAAVLGEREFAARGPNSAKAERDGSRALTNSVAVDVSTAPGRFAIPGMESADSVTTIHEPTADSLVDQVHQRVSDQMERLREQGNIEIQMSLDPPELGHVQLQLTLEDGTLSVRLAVETENARLALDHQMDHLRARFAEMGLSLGQFDVRRDSSSRDWQPPTESNQAGHLVSSEQRNAAGYRKSYPRMENGDATVDVFA